MSKQTDNDSCDYNIDKILPELDPEVLDSLEHRFEIILATKYIKDILGLMSVEQFDEVISKMEIGKIPKDCEPGEFIKVQASYNEKHFVIHCKLVAHYKIIDDDYALSKSKMNSTFTHAKKTKTCLVSAKGTLMLCDYCYKVSHFSNC